jgi:hypothetical protein
VLIECSRVPGNYWKNFDLSEAEKPDTIDKLLKILDKVFEYNNRV